MVFRYCCKKCSCECRLKNGLKKIVWFNKTSNEDKNGPQKCTYQ